LEIESKTEGLPVSRGLLWMLNFAKNARYGARQFRRAPGYAVFTVLVLALGIGTVTAMFTISYGVLLRPLPFAADRQLFGPLEQDGKNDDYLGAAYAEIRQWQQATADSADIAFTRGGLNIVDTPSGAVLVSEVTASPNLFSLLGVSPMLGRDFLPTEQETDHPNVVLLSYAMWQRSFAGDHSVLGKTVHIGGAGYTVVGVMPREFEYPVWDDRPEVWVPLQRSAMTPSAKDPYGASFEPIVRVHGGVPVNRVEAQIAHAHAEFVAHGKQTHVHLVRKHDLMVHDVQPALFALEIAVGVVWLIACCNVAGLLLARVAARRTEIAVRSALGAGRRRIVAQFLTESLLLSAAGAMGGLALAMVMLRTFRHMLGKMLPMAPNIHLNWAVFLSLLFLTLLTALAFGTFPALLAAWTGMQAGFGRKQAGDRGQSRARAVLLVGEVALSIALLSGAGLMMRTMYALRHVPLGFRTDHLLLTSMTASSSEYTGRNIGTMAWQPVLDAVRQMPGVESAAMSTVMPLEHPVELETIVYKTDWMQADYSAVVRAASPGLMDVLGVRMRSGRFFVENDTASSLPVVVVNRTFVNWYLGGGDALGKQIRFGRTPWAATIVGVIDDVHQDDVAAASQPELYVCMAQVTPDNSLYRALLGRYMQLAVRTEIAPGAMIPEVRRKVAEANSRLAIGDFTTMEAAVEDSLGAQRMAAEVVGVFGGLALLITVVGLYGLLSYLVEQRTQEIGIRMALGADRGAVVGMVLRQTLMLMGAGVVTGLGMALWSNRLLHGFLYGVSATDPWTMGLAPLGLVICGLLAAVVPARRAAGVNPVEALRAE
jgi:predicted permease